jgi:hypothetical protein
MNTQNGKSVPVPDHAGRPRSRVNSQPIAFTNLKRMGKRKIWEKLLSSERLGAGKAPGSAERTAFQDYDRIVFTSAFRRMKDKTQVFPYPRATMSVLA